MRNRWIWATVTAGLWTLLMLMAAAPKQGPAGGPCNPGNPQGCDVIGAGPGVEVLVLVYLVGLVAIVAVTYVRGRRS